MRIRISIVHSDHAAQIRRVVIRNPELAIGQLFDNGRDALMRLQADQADIILVATSLAGVDGAYLTSFITRSCPGVRVANLVENPDNEMTVAAIAAGAIDFIPEDLRGFDFGERMKSILQGRSTMTPWIANWILEKAWRRDKINFNSDEINLMRRIIAVKRHYDDSHIIRDIYHRLHLFYRPIERTESENI